jgi:hypothetical protein
MEERRNPLDMKMAVLFSVLLLMIGGISFSYSSQRLDIGSVPPLRFKTVPRLQPAHNNHLS